jgi:hypothetical protein
MYTVERFRVDLLGYPVETENMSYLRHPSEEVDFSDIQLRMMRRLR